VYLDGRLVGLVVDERFQQQLLVAAFQVTLSVHIFRDDIGGIFRNLSIVEMDFVRSGVENGVGMCPSK
jgi:hypothetical protein